MRRLKMVILGGALAAMLAIPATAGASSYSCLQDAYWAYRRGETTLAEYQQAVRDCAPAQPGLRR